MDLLTPRWRFLLPSSRTARGESAPANRTTQTSIARSQSRDAG